MQKVNRNTKKQILQICIVTLTALLTAMVIVLATHREYYAVSLADGWNVSFSKAEYTDISLSEISFSRIASGDTIYLRTNLPAGSMVQPTLNFALFHCAFEVCLDGERIFAEGQEEFEREELLGGGYYHIPLPQDYAGKELTIEIKKTAGSSFNHFNEMRIMSSQDIFHSTISENFLAILITVLLIGAGAAGLGSTVFVLKLKYSPQILMSLSVFSILMGGWISCNTRVAQLLIQDTLIITKMEFVCLYYMPAAMASMLNGFLKEKNAKRLMKVIEFAFLAAATAAVLLQAANILNLTAELLFFQLAIIISLCIIARLMIKERKSHINQADKIIDNGMIVFFLFVVIEIVCYILQKNFDARQENININAILPVGLMVLIIAMFVGFAFRLYQNMTETIEKKALLKIAYTDALTKINNRAKCEEILREYEEKKKPILIINMDLNHFKEVNDTFGHSEGDNLLCIFANLLKEVYDGIGYVGRMGGDEFIIILDPMEKEYIQQKIMELKKKVQEKNAEGTLPFVLAFAYGSATNKGDVSVTPWKVYEQADQAMYHCKRKQKRNEKTKRA